MSNEYYNIETVKQQEKVAGTRDMVSQRNVVKDRLALASGESVLDVGSGNGILAREMALDVGPNGYVLGIDPSESMVSMAKATCPEAEFVLGDAMKLPTEDMQFDAATACQVMCFVPDINKALSEIYRTLKPGGRLVILDTDWGSLIWTCKDKALMDRAIDELTSPYTSAYVPRNLSLQLKESGFDITSRNTHTILNWEYSSDSFSRQLAGFIANQSDKEKLEYEFSQLSESGKYMFSMNRYVFCVTRR